MSNVCEICGVTGYYESLIVCLECKKSTQHFYCLDKVSESSGDLSWICEQCQPERSKIGTLKCNGQVNKRKGGTPMTRTAANAKYNWERDRKKGRSRKTGTRSAAKVFPNPDDIFQKGGSRKTGTRSAAKVFLNPDDIFQEYTNCLTGEMLQTAGVASAGPQFLEITKHNKSDRFEGSGASPKEEMKKSLQLCNERIEGDSRKRKRLIIDDEDEEPVQSPNSCPTVACISDSRDGLGDVALEVSEHQTVERVCDANPDPSNISCPAGKAEGFNGIGDSQKGEKELSQLCNERTTRDKRKRRRLIIDDEIDDENNPDEVSSAFPNSASAVAQLISSGVAVFEDSKHQSVGEVCDSHDVAGVTVLQGPTHETVEKVSYANHVPSNISCEARSFEKIYEIAPTKPIIDSVWRGGFEIGGKNYGPMAAHPSNKACLRVVERATMLPQMLFVEKHPRCDVWPMSFQASPPDDEAIGLFFFPEWGRDKTMFSQLLEDIIESDLALKIALDDAELLIFSSNLLPKPYRRFQGNCYLWGVFRAMQVPSICQELCEVDKDDSDSEICNLEPSDSVNADKATLEVLSPYMPDRLGLASKAISDDDCEINTVYLNLFPLETEDIAIKARMGEENGIDLNLGLSWGMPSGSKLTRSKLDTQTCSSPSPGKLLYESWQKFRSSLRSQPASSTSIGDSA